jgi:hypothetical protein
LAEDIVSEVFLHFIPFIEQGHGMLIGPANRLDQGFVRRVHAHTIRRLCLLNTGCESTYGASDASGIANRWGFCSTDSFGAEQIECGRNCRDFPFLKMLSEYAIRWSVSFCAN